MEETKSTLEEKLIAALAQAPIPDSQLFAAQHEVPHQVLDGVLKSLEVDDYVLLKKDERHVLTLTAEAVDICAHGSPEWRLLQAVASEAEAVPKDKLAEKTAMALGLINIAAGKLVKSKWATLDKTSVSSTPAGVEVAKSGEDADAVLLRRMRADPRPEAFSTEEVNRMKKRKAVKVEKINYYEVSKGAEFKAIRKKAVGELTQEMLKTGEWEHLEFKGMKLNALGKVTGGEATGSLHPLLQMREQFREILLEMGFEEMPTNRWVESSFWNFDALFQPQQHPARDLHDTFYISDPAVCSSLPQNDYVQRVKDVH